MSSGTRASGVAAERSGVSHPLWVGVNLLWLVPGVVGGSEEYTLRLLRAVSDGGHDDLHLRLYGSRELFDAHPDLTERFEAVPSPRVAPAKAARILYENTWLPAVSQHDDLVHHGGGVVPSVRTQTPIVTVHDLQPLDMPEHFSAAKRRWLGAMIPRAVLAARLVLCPSRFTADRLRSRFALSNDRLVVVSQGLAEPPRHTASTATGDHRARYGRFLLLPAIAYPHKRHCDLIRALSLLRERHDDLSVVLTGGPGPETSAIKSLVAELGLDSWVHMRGRVPEQELDELYRSAEAMVFPSAYEGFGNPVLEAMARGCPVVTTDAASLPEVGGDAVLTVSVGDPTALAAAIDRLLTEPALRTALVERGLNRAATFSSADAGALLADCYRSAAQPTVPGERKMGE